MATRSRTRTLVVRILGLTAWTIFLVVATLLLTEAIRVNGMAPLQRWHEKQSASEFKARDAKPGFAFAQYLQREEAVFKDMSQYAVAPQARATTSPIIRYMAGGPGDSAMFAPNWNRTQILEPSAEPVGGALLLHGLTDSPYSMRSIAERLQSEGYLCICLRYPGHGTVPAGILEADYEDWFAAVKLAWAALQERTPKGRPVCICGYSTGGALAVLLTLEAITRGERIPDRLFLLSPAIGITPFAIASNLHRLYSWIPFYNKARWLSIEPEYDPYKYNSFPQHAAAQSWALTERLSEALAAAAANGSISEMPPIATFQSLVDATVVAPDIITRLYDRLPKNGSEIVVFDVNRGTMLEGLLSQSVPSVKRLLEDPTLNFGVTLVTNANPGARELVAHDHLARSSEVVTAPLDLAWPPQVYSLAHVAIPFPNQDPIYGDGHTPAAPARLNIGSLSMRGERGVLAISADDLMRLRHNPFHAYMLDRILRALPPR